MLPLVVPAPELPAAPATPVVVAALVLVPPLEPLDVPPAPEAAVVPVDAAWLVLGADAASSPVHPLARQDALKKSVRTATFKVFIGLARVRWPAVRASVHG
jgi:hypothetical protein